MKELLFNSHYSIGESLITLEDELEIDKGPVSAIAIAKAHNLPYISVVDSSLSGFVQGYESCKKNKIGFRFGYKVCVCEDINNKSEESFNTESNIVVWALNSAAYPDLVKISTKAACDGFYYIPRIDYKSLKELWTQNLRLSMPFYSSFLARNTTKYNSRCIPDFSFTDPVFHLENHDLPFDPILRSAVQNFAKVNSYDTMETHTCYYYRREDSLKHQIFRCIHNRTKTEKPNLEHYSVNNFCVEAGDIL